MDDGPNYTAGPDSDGLRINRDGGLCLGLTIGESVFVEAVGGYPLQIHLIRIHGDKIRLRFSEVPNASLTPIVREALVKRVLRGAKLNTSTRAGARISKFLQVILDCLQ